MKAKGHLEFCQWFKRYFELNYEYESKYDPVKTRNGKKLYYIMDSRQQEVEKDKSGRPGFIKKISMKINRRTNKIDFTSQGSPPKVDRAAFKSRSKRSASKSKSPKKSERAEALEAALEEIEDEAPEDAEQLPSDQDAGEAAMQNDYETP